MVLNPVPWQPYLLTSSARACECSMFICTYTFCFIGKKEKNLATINVILLYKRSVKKIAFTINVILHMLICMCWAPVPECGSWVEPAKFPIGLTLHASCFGAYQYPSSHHFLLKESRFFFKKNEESPLSILLPVCQSAALDGR